MTFLLIVTLSSMALAAIMSVIAWRIAAEERRRSDARVAALAADIHAPAAAEPRAVAAQASGGRAEPRVASFPVQRSAPKWDEDLPIRPVVEHRAGVPALFAQQQRPQKSRLGVVFVVVLAAAAAALAWTATDGVRHRGQTATVPDPVPVVPVAPAPPLELVALGHERDADRLTVRGVVRNPAAGAAADQLTAVILVFGPDGGFLTSGRAIIDAPTLRPGGESTFVVTVPGAGAVARYRVSFRSGDSIVPHVDRREPPRSAS